MTVRQATTEDLGALGEMLLDFTRQEDMTKWNMDFDVKKAFEVVKAAVNQRTVYIAYEDNNLVAGIVGTVVESAFSTEIMYQEIIFYVRRPYRRLTSAFLAEVEKIMKAKHINKIIIAHATDGTEEKMQRFYRIKGYAKLETHYVKELI